MTVICNGQWLEGNNGGDVGEWRKKAGEKERGNFTQLRVDDQDMEIPHSRL